MTKRTLAVMAVVLGTLGVEATTAQAQEVQVSGPLAGEPAVRKMRIYRQGRIQLQPFYSVTIQDEFTRNHMFGLQANYHFLDWLGIGVWAAYAGVHGNTNITDEVEQRGITANRNALSLPSRGNFSSQTGKINWVTVFQGTFAPLRGKVALFQSLFLDTDFYIHAGVALVGVQERANVEAQTARDVCSPAPPPDAEPSNNQCVNTQTQTQSRIAIAPSFGVGLSFYMTDWFGLTFEWRGLPFKWHPSGFDNCCRPEGKFPDGQIDSSDRLFKFNQMVSVGLAFYLPPQAGISE